MAQQEELKNGLGKLVLEFKSQIERIEKKKKENKDRIEDMEWKILTSERENARDKTERYYREKETLSEAQNELEKRKEELQEQQFNTEELLQGARAMIENMSKSNK